GVVIQPSRLAPPSRERLARLWLGSEAENVPVGIFHLHLQCPRVVRGRVANLSAGGTVLLVKSLHIFDAHPDPGPGLALAPLTEVDAGAVAVHGGKVVGAPVRVLKSQHVHVIAKADRHVLDLEDWGAAFESRSQSDCSWH